MPISINKAQTTENRHYYQLPNGTDTWITSFIGMNSVERRAKNVGPREPVGFPPPLEPIAYLVEQGSNMTNPGHYHQADQFQVFLSQGGKFGVKPIDMLTVHYATAFSPYAPIQAAEEKVVYLTLRNGWDPGARWMPQFKEELKASKLPHRSGVGKKPAVFGETGGVAELTTLDQQEIIPSSEDGMASTLYQCPAGTQITGPEPSSGAGQYWLVVKGECDFGGRKLEHYGLSFVAPSEQAVVIRATDQPVAILMMQFAKRLSA